MTFDLAPKSWRKVSLSDCCKIISGATPRRDNPEYWGGTIPWVTPKDLSKLEGSTIEDAPEYITEKGYRNCSTDLLPKGAVLFSSRAPIGHVAIAGRPMCTNQGFKSLIPGDELTSPYLYWCLRKLVPEISARGTGTTFKEVSKAVMEEFEIPLPPLPEQKRIAAILDKADSIRRKRQVAVRLTEELLRSVFLEMFGDPVTNPKGWGIKSLSEEIEFLTSGSRGWAEFYSEAGCKFIRIQNVKNGVLHFSDVQHVNPPDNKEAARTKVQENDLLISITADLGRTAVVDKITANEGAHINQHLALVRLSKAFNPHFVAAYLESEGGKRQFLQLDQSAVKSGLNFDSIKSLHLFNPPLQMQNRYASFVHALERAKGKLRTSSEVTDNLFNSLLHRAFEGEL